MKLNQKIIYGMLVFGTITGNFACKKGFVEINQPYKDAGINTQTVAGLFNGLAKNITNEDNTLYISLFYGSTNQQAVQNKETPYLNYSSSLWNSYYPSLKTYKALLKLISEQPNPSVFENIRLMAGTMMASRTLHMLDYYGNIPYSKASLADGGTEFYRPVYDKEIDVYKSALADLKAASDGIKVSSSQTSLGASDSFLFNDLNAWVKFTNALRLRYAVRLYNKEQALASEIINDIIGGNKPLPNNQASENLLKNNFGVWPGSLTPKISLETQWYSFRETSVSNIRMSSNVWAQMATSAVDPAGATIFDPRCYVFFQTNNADKWIPQPQDRSVSDGGLPYKGDLKARQPIGADPENKFAAFNFFLVYDQVYCPRLIITEADVHLLKAEIYQRGMGVGKNITLAKSEYEAGITSSVDFWYTYTKNSDVWTTKPTAPTPVQMTAFLTNPKVAYNGANDADALKKIATQAWLATMFQPAEAWAIVRRTGLTPKDANTVPSTVVKLPYPNDESVNNAENWRAATGGADPTAQSKVKVYWMP